jgi:ubiquinone/menaquinone biosynthesis C-methylase UbiE
MDKNTTSRFDELAAAWDQNPVRVALAKAIGNKISQAVPILKDWRVLDYGAGTGLLTLQLQPLAESVLAVDASAGMLKELARKLASAGIKNVNARQWDLGESPFPERGFDLVTSSMTFHHLRDIPLILERLAELLKPGGWIAIADLDVEDGSFHGPLPDVFHQGFERSQISEWLAKAGFGRVEVTDAHRLDKPDASGKLRNYSIFLAVGQKT